MTEPKLKVTDFNNAQSYIHVSDTKNGKAGVLDEKDVALVQQDFCNFKKGDKIPFNDPSYRELRYSVFDALFSKDALTHSNVTSTGKDVSIYISPTLEGTGVKLHGKKLFIGDQSLLDLSGGTQDDGRDINKMVLIRTSGPNSITIIAIETSGKREVATMKLNPNEDGKYHVRIEPDILIETTTKITSPNCTMHLKCNPKKDKDSPNC